MSASAFHVTRSSTGVRVWFTVTNANGSLRTGLVGANFTVTLIRDDDGASNNPTVTESAQLAGAYYFDVPSAFLTTSGDNYFMVIQVTLAPVSVTSAPLFVSQSLWDQLETEADASTRATTNQTEHDATQAAITALNDLAIADVQTALTNQGYTAARAPNLDNLDAAVSSRSSHSAADVWDQLTSAHTVPGSFGLLIATNLDVVVSTRSSHSAADVDTTLSGTHGAGSWATATGFATPGDAMTLTGAAETSLLGVFDTAHGVGSWVGAGLTTAQDDRLRYLWKAFSGDPTNPTTHVRAKIGTNGSITTPDSEVDVTVVQVDADTATFTQA